MFSLVIKAMERRGRIEVKCEVQVLQVFESVDEVGLEISLLVWFRHRPWLCEVFDVVIFVKPMESYSR